MRILVHFSLLILFIFLGLLNFLNQGIFIGSPHVQDDSKTDSVQILPSQETLLWISPEKSNLSRLDLLIDHSFFDRNHYTISIINPNEEILYKDEFSFWGKHRIVSIIFPPIPHEDPIGLRIRNNGENSLVLLLPIQTFYIQNASFQEALVVLYSEMGFFTLIFLVLSLISLFILFWILIIHFRPSPISLFLFFIGVVFLYFVIHHFFFSPLLLQAESPVTLTNFVDHWCQNRIEYS